MNDKSKSFNTPQCMQLFSFCSFRFQIIMDHNTMRRDEK